MVSVGCKFIIVGIYKIQIVSLSLIIFGLLIPCSADDYLSSKFLYLLLKVRNLNDISDLYNAQDVILMWEIVENRFKLMYKTYDFNTRKSNSDSTLNGCVQRDLLKNKYCFTNN